MLTVELIGQGYRTKVTQPALYEKGPVVEIKVRELLADASWCAVVMSFEIGQTKYRWERKCQLKYAKKGEAWGVSIGRNVGQAQYLEVKARSGVGSDLVRLNTLFGKQLVARSSEGVKKVLSWSTQSLSEPALLSTEQPQIVDFKGANGLYFYELFLHLPLMVAVRLSEQGQHDEAQSWFNAHLFDPYRLEELADGTAPVWGARPLAEEGYTSYQQYAARPGTALKQADIYRRAIFLEFLENWQRQGDHAYRRLTVSGLSQAWMCYQDALKLIGPFPGLKMASPWNTVSLGDLKRTVFRHPVNERIVRLRSRLESRIYNLRNGLALDGKRIPSADIDVQDNVSLSAFGGGKSLVDQNYNGEGGTIPAYRFRHLLPATRAAVQQLLDLGRHYMKLMEDQFNTGFSVQLKAQEMKIAEFVIRAQQEQLEAARARRAALVISRDAAVFRKEHYAGLLEEGRSALEEAASATISSSALMKYAAIPTEIVAGGIDGLVPTILGMAVGGTKPSELTRMTAKAMDMGSTALKFISEQLLVESGYERRATEWRFAQGESEWDIKVLEQQLVEADIDVKAATTALEQVKQDAVNLQAAYTSMTTGFTIIPTYDWLVARQELLYGAAYDAVFSQCMSLQAAWRFELGDYKTQSFIKPSAWNDSFKGMLAGESLMVDLQAMENDYLMNNERRLTIKKTFSLYDSLESYCGEVVEQSLNQDNVAGAKREAEFKKRFLTLREAGWVKNLNLLRKGLFRFGTPQRFFDDNFPGHYKRQIKHVSFSLLTKTPSPFEISAVVTQTHSQILTEPDAVGAEFIRSMNIHEAPKNVPPSTVKLDLRSGQKVTLTSTLAEDGLGYGPGLWVYELMMHDGRYLPFEGTGACSAWRLEIPHVKFAEWLAGGGDNSVYEKANLKDLQIHMVYTALDGGASFGEKIRGLQSKHRVDEKKLSYDQSAPE